VTEQLRLFSTLDADRRALLRVRGEVDLATADQFREAALDAVRRHERVVFDLEGAMILDASGLRVLHTVLREARRLARPAPVLRGVRPLLARSLELAGLSDAFPREPHTPITCIPQPARNGTLAPATAGLAAAV
jgi:anti-anti-sigma factor